MGQNSSSESASIATNIISEGDIKQKYDFLEVLGRGSFAKVHKAAKKIDGTLYAIKVIRKKDLNREELEYVHDEIIIMRKVEHPNIVKLYEVFETSDKVYLVLELLEGGELFDRIIARRNFSEEEASHIIRDITSAVGYLHSHGIVHRDLKPENLLFKNNEADAPIKITDFGLAKFFSLDSARQMGTSAGTPLYAAPEVVSKHMYGPEVDLWSIGVITFVLLCGYPPFFHEEAAVLFELIRHAKYEYNETFWGTISKDAKNLIDGLLKVDTRERFTTEKVMNHPWIKNKNELKRVPLNIAEKMKASQARARLQRSLHAVLAASRLKHRMEVSKSPRGRSPDSLSMVSSPEPSPRFNHQQHAAITPFSLGSISNLNSMSVDPSPRKLITNADTPVRVARISSDASSRLTSARGSLTLPAPMSMFQIKSPGLAPEVPAVVFMSPRDIVANVVPLSASPRDVGTTAVLSPKDTATPAAVLSPKDKILVPNINMAAVNNTRSKIPLVGSPDSPVPELTEEQVREEANRKKKLQCLSIHSGASSTTSNIAKFDFS